MEMQKRSAWSQLGKLMDVTGDALWDRTSLLILAEEIAMDVAFLGRTSLLLLAED